MSFKRKLQRKLQPKVPKCCGEKMTFKHGYGCYVCESCGKEKRVEE